VATRLPVVVALREEEVVWALVWALSVVAELVAAPAGASNSSAAAVSAVVAGQAVVAQELVEAQRPIARKQATAVMAAGFAAGVLQAVVASLAEAAAAMARAGSLSAVPAPAAERMIGWAAAGTLKPLAREVRGALKQRVPHTWDRERSSRCLPLDIQRIDRNEDIHLLSIPPWANIHTDLS
jgi:hypothetical protein